LVEKVKLIETLKKGGIRVIRTCEEGASSEKVNIQRYQPYVRPHQHGTGATLPQTYRHQSNRPRCFHCDRSHSMNVCFKV